MPQSNSPQRWQPQGADPLSWFLDPQGIDFSNPNAFMPNLGPRQAPPSSGGSPKKPKPPKDEVLPPGSPTGSSPPSAPAPSAPVPGTPPLTDREKFEQGLRPFVESRLRMANNPLSVKRAREWYDNQLAGYDARQRMNARAERQRAALIEQGKKKKAQREADRKYRTDLAAELEASRKFGEQNPAQPTGPSPEKMVDRLNAEYSARQGQERLQALVDKRGEEERLRQLEAKRLADSMAETDAMRQTLFGYDKAEAARLRGAGERTATAEAASAAAAADAAAKAQVESTLLPRDVNSLMLGTPTGQLAALATPMEGNVTAPLNPQLIPNQFVQPAPGLLDMNRMAERELFDKQMADAEQEKKIRAIVEGTMANYNAGRNTSPAPALGQRNPEAEAMAARAPRMPTSQVMALHARGIPTIGAPTPEQTQFNDFVDRAMAQGYSREDATQMALDKDKTFSELFRERVMRDPNLASFDPQGLNVMSGMDMLAGEAGLALAAKGLRAAGILAPRVPRAAASAPVDTPMVPEVRSAPAQPNRFTPTTPEETALQAELQGIRPFDAGSAAARRSQMAEADRLRNRIREMGADPEVVTGPTNVPEGPSFARPGDELPPLQGAPRRRPDRLSPESIEAAQNEGMLFDIGAPSASPKAPAAAATETATATGSAPKGQMTFDQLYEAPKAVVSPKATSTGIPKAGTKASRLARLSPEAQQQELAKAYDRAFSELRAGTLSQAEFDQIVANTLKGQYGGVFRKVLESQSFSRVKEAKSAVEGVLGTQTWRDKITDPLGNLLPNPR